jgi:hypothetical protein
VHVLRVRVAIRLCDRAMPDTSDHHFPSDSGGSP